MLCRKVLRSAGSVRVGVTVLLLRASKYLEILETSDFDLMN